ncbi:LLM class flavin-dependent oxidoreductase [Agromyces aerolatus]|uniref:LLM class flavin-dependent oxidoreductase n=1 Tax=Agromyces sp. LY-1074 TaxID=3074080 RepID=UPI002861F9C7|nr:MULTISPECIES: LLM class flavin-dependent oxidoreductase [unclassified Agromyces]MDR5699098.1 LLM class flavin-dependent oxidoreductase [Agromyces sp. LY-1074]MDR5705123.1 LLM class flavin-dependent oxidoreductase [Agromyces sp. LY-1358]
MKFASELLQIPGPPDVTATVMARATLLDELGFDIGMIGHHRFVSGNPSAVFTLLSAVAARTDQLMLGTGVLVLPAYHPLDIAEQVATLDQVSGGRAFLGVGAGYRAPEIAATGRDPQDRGSLMTEALEVLDAVWGAETASYHGKHFHFDDVTIEPRPVQDRPLIIVGTKAKVGARRAGRLADGVLGGLVQTVEEYRPTVDLYRETAAANDRTARLWLQRSVCIADSRAELEETWLPGFLENRRGKLALGPGLASSAVDFAILEGRTPSLEEAAEGCALVGTADEVIQQIRDLQDRIEIDALVVNHHWSTGDDATIERQLRRFAHEVRPAFALADARPTSR